MRRVSIVIPSFNHVRFVAEAIRSVAAQAVPDLELVVVDDGSTDGTGEVVRSTLAELGLATATFLEQENQGAHRAIARGVEATTGEIVTVLNSDDRYHPERLVRMLRELPDRGDFLAFSLARMIDATGEEYGAETPPVLAYRHALYEASRCPTVGFALLRNNISVSTGNLIFSRTLYDKIGGFTAFRLAHDWDFVLQALVHVEPIFVPEPLLDYRTHGQNERTQAAGLAEEEGRAIIGRYFARCRESAPDNPLAPCEANWPVYFDLFVSRYHAWFGQGPLRDWIEEMPEPRSRGVWRAWSDAVSADPVDDCDYLVDASLDPATRTALALAREVLIAEAHPLADEEGAGPDTLREVYARQGRRLPKLRLPPWRSPVNRRLAAPSPRAIARRVDETGRASIRKLLRRSADELGRAARIAKWRRVVQRSGIFDTAYYRDQCRARNLAVVDPIGHYLRRGADLGLDPHPLFQTAYYLSGNSDVRGTNPLVHYLLHGDAEGRTPSPFFDPAWYRASNPDVAHRGMNTLSHWLRHGEGEGRAGHPRFDAGHYLEHLEGPPSGNLLGHYVEHGRKAGIGVNRRDSLRMRFEANDAPDPGIAVHDRARITQATRQLLPSGFFDADYYASRWGSGADAIVDPARHFYECGALNGVGFCPPAQIQSRLRELEPELDADRRPELAYLRAAGSPPPLAGPHSVTLFVSSKGNTFFREMARILAQGFESAGAGTRIVDETYDPPPEPGRNEHWIVLSPHEFFVLGDGPKRLSRRFLGSCSLWLAEQPGSEFFAMCVWFARFARRVLDINPLSALAWGELGVTARALPLGWDGGLPEFADRLDFESAEVRASQAPEARAPVSIDLPLAERPIDIFFNGVLTRRREEFFADNAWLFSELRCALFMPSAHAPVSAMLPSSLDARDATALTQRAKILLNVHRSETPYLEWHRLIVRGIWQKTLVVSEPSLRVPYFRPSEHYVECTLAEMPRKIDWLLRSDEGRAEAEAIRTRAFEVLRRRYPMAALAAAFLAEDSTEQGAA